MRLRCVSRWWIILSGDTPYEKEAFSWKSNILIGAQKNMFWLFVERDTPRHYQGVWQKKTRFRENIVAPSDRPKYTGLRESFCVLITMMTSVFLSPEYLPASMVSRIPVFACHHALLTSRYTHESVVFAHQGVIAQKGPWSKLSYRKMIEQMFLKKWCNEIG